MICASAAHANHGAVPVVCLFGGSVMSGAMGQRDCSERQAARLHHLHRHGVADPAAQGQQQEQQDEEQAAHRERITQVKKMFPCLAGDGAPGVGLSRVGHGPQPPELQDARAYQAGHFRAACMAANGGDDARTVQDHF